jgi:hypothetical protein
MSQVQAKLPTDTWVKATWDEYRIDESQVLPRLDIALLEEAFRRSRQMNHGKVSAWLLSQFQA